MTPGSTASITRVNMLAPANANAIQIHRLPGRRSAATVAHSDAVASGSARFSETSSCE